jgi:hypothetical protein
VSIVGGWQNGRVPMREECKYFESRTYANGETVRKCDLDLAPEAPWRCPENCSSYTRRMADVNWSHGSIVTPPTPDEPGDALDRDDGSVAAVLDEAEDIINAIGAQVMAEVGEEQKKAAGRPIEKVRRIFRRKR